MQYLSLLPTALFGLALLSTPAAAYTGDMTYYDPGPGSCGAYSSPNDDVVALSRAVMANGANPNANPKCFRHIAIRNPGTGMVHDATVVDTCWLCKEGDIDVSPGLFPKVAPAGDGTVGGIEWWFT